MNEAYLSEKQIKKKRMLFKLKIFAVIAAPLLLFSLVFYLVAYSKIFKIKNIEIVQTDGEGEIDKDKLVEDYKAFLTVQSKINSFLGADNILTWKNIFAENFLKNYARLNKFEVEKNFGSRQIKLTIESRKKMGIWCEAEQNKDVLIKDCYWFDKNGIIFDNAPYAEGELIYKINDFSGRDLKLGDSAIDKEMFENLNKIFDILGQSDIKIGSFKIKSLEFKEIETDLSLAPKIYFSLKIDPAFTLPAFQSLKKIGLDKVDYVDFRVENRAYYKLK